MNQKILIVDDDPDIREVVRLALESENFEPVAAEDGETALALCEAEEPALLILDIMLPDIGGRELFKQIRDEYDIPTIFLSRKSEDIDRILGLELGADGYVTKPFNPRELVARVKAVLRRIRKASRAAREDESNDGGEEVRSYGRLTLDPVERRVTWEGEEVELTKIQFDLLEAMMRYPKKVYSRAELIDRAYGETIVSERTIDSHMRRIREALQQVGGDPIQTKRGVGFTLRK